MDLVWYSWSYSPLQEAFHVVSEFMLPEGEDFPVLHLPRDNPVPIIRNIG